jgi:gliding motility-associated-like protein
VTGLPAGVNGSWASDAVTISGTPSESGSFTYTVELSGGCGTISETGIIIVSPDNTVTLTSLPGTDNQTVCINTAITDITWVTTGATGASVTGFPAGVTGMWNAEIITISGTPSESGSFTYTIELSGGCGTVTETGTINVTPDNTITLSSLPGTENQTVCINIPIIPVTYTTTGATGADITGLPQGVSGVWASDMVTISGTPAEQGVFNYTIVLNGGCGTVSETGVLTVNPDNTITLTSGEGTDNQTICLGEPITTITYATTGATGSDFTGLPDGMTVSWAANVVTISGTPLTAGSYTYRIDLTGGCGSVMETGSIIVLPENTITISSAAGTDDQTLCINTPVTNIVYQTTGATDATVSGLPDGVTAVWSSGELTISGTPSVSGIFNYNIELIGGCGVVITSGKITITPDNTVVLTSAAGTDTQSICEGLAITDITYTTTGASGVSFNGLPEGVTGAWASDVATISGTPSESGIFNYSVVLSGGCGSVTANGSITINPILPVSVTVSPDANPSCAGNSVVFTAIPVNGGTAPVYQWLVNGMNAGLNSDTYSYIPANNDIINVILASSEACVTDNPATSVPVVMTVNDSPSATVTSVTDVLCFGQSTGSVDIAVTGGTMPYTFLWDNGAETEDLTDVPAGTYEVVITDANSCIATATAVVAQPLSALTGLVTSQTNVSVIGGNDGSVTVTAAGGVPPYQFCLDGGTYQSDGTFGTLTAGNYVVTVRDNNLCTYDVPVTIKQPALPLWGMITDQVDVLCFGESTGSVTVTGMDGVEPYEYSLDGVTFVTSGTFDNLSAGTYTVTVRDAELTTAGVPVEILQPATAVTVATSQLNVRCNGGSDAYAVALPSGGTGSYAFVWNTTPVQNADTAAGLSTGTYMVTVTDANLCSAGAEVTITEPEVLTASATTSDANCPDSEDGSISLSISGGTPAYSVFWEDPTTEGQNRTAVLPGTYNAVIADANGCATSVSAVVGFIGTFNCVVIPNIITPEPADGYNDEWIIRNIHIYPDAEVKVFTRWGRLIYHSKNPSAEPWNGRYSNGNLVPTDTYHYILDLHDGSKTRSGIISVIR